MISTTVSGLESQPFDVIVLGGAISGSGLALLLKRDLPELKVAIVERSAEFDRKVGESTSEVGGCFLTKVLNLGDYLPFEHFVKQGLRMWFHRSKDDSVCDCAELGPRYQTRLPGYQLDRSKLDKHLLEKASGLGCTVLRPVTVREIDLVDGEGGTVAVKDADGGKATLSARWIIDASGKAAVLARKRKTIVKHEDEHPTSSMWVRFTNVRSLDSEDARNMAPSLKENVFSHRGAATNHLAGYGWWSWIIPLKNGDHSVGITYDRRIFTPPEADGTVPGRIKEHVLQHPVGRLMFEDAEPVPKDAHAYKGLAYHSTEVMGDGWGICGDAAGFMDPLYSQGIDFCGHTVCAVHDVLMKFYKQDDSEMMAEADDWKCAAMEYNERYPEAYMQWFRALYVDKYYYIGDAELMYAAFLLDLATYFLGPVKFVYEDTEKEFPKMPFNGPIGAGIAKFMAFYNRRLATIARKRIAAGTYGRRNTNTDAYLIARAFSHGPAALTHLRWGLMAWMKAEVNALFLPAPKSDAPMTQQTPVPFPAVVGSEG